MKQTESFIEGPILGPLLRFTFPILLALLLQAMYGAMDLMVVGRFGQPADVSAVSTGSQVMHTVTALITGLSMGATVLLGQKLGEGKPEEGGKVLGSAIALFAVVALVLTGAMLATASPMARLMQAPVEAFNQTVIYVRICSGGAAFIVLYLIFLILLGLPIMVMEFSVGRASRKSVARAFDVLEPKGTHWHKFKWVGIVGFYLLMMFYTLPAGCCHIFRRWP